MQIHPIIKPHANDTAKRTLGETLLGCKTVRYTAPSGKHKNMQNTN